MQPSNNSEEIDTFWGLYNLKNACILRSKKNNYPITLEFLKQSDKNNENHTNMKLDKLNNYTKFS